jgi:hypothetical protein
MKIDQENFVPQLKDKLKGDLASLKEDSPHDDKLTLLLGLSRVEKEEEEIINLMDQATLLYETWKTIDEDEVRDCELEFAILYFYLNQKEFCHAHYHRVVDGLLRKDEAIHPETLNNLREIMGLELNSIEDLKTRDPFETIQLMLQVMKNKR